MPELIPLPTPIYEGSTSVEEALYHRRSIREYKDDPLKLREVSQLLWAAQGITNPNGKRTAPSAGALYPLEVYLLAGEVDELSAGIYKYLPHEHALTIVTSGDFRQDVYSASFEQEMILDAPASIVISTIYERTSIKYGMRTERYVHMEVGSVAENIYLQAEPLAIGTVFIGAFSDDQVKRVLKLQSQEQPLAIFPIGRK